jgi:endonuclease/exonuclease/phosphatase (EEP) superfamily protein YafD
MDAASPPAPVSPRGRGVLDLAACGLAAATVAGWCGGWHWILDLASHFRWYWLLFALAGLFVARRRATWLARGCLAVAVLGNAWPLLPYWLPAAAPAPGAATPAADALAIVSVNVLRRNADKAAVLAYLRSRDPDLVVVLEVDAAWAAALAGLADRWPHAIVEPREDNFGIALLAKQPPRAHRVCDFGAAGVPSIVAEFAGPPAAFTLVATHPLAPQARNLARGRDRQLRAIADFVAASPWPCVVAGDLNTTPWSAAFRDLVARSGLRDTALGRGLRGTWNARLWAPRIPIDHVLAPPAAEVLDRSVGPDVGSDHFPVEVRLRLKAR